MRASTWRCSSVCGCGKYSPFDTTWVGIGEPSASASSARINPASWRSDSQESSSREPGKRLGMGSSSLALTMPFYPELSGRTRLRAPERRGTREHQRLDHDRHGAGGLEQRADVDEVEFLENDPVDRHDRVRHARFFAAMNTDQAADVAFADEDERGAPLEHFREARRHAPAEIIEPRERRGPCPAIAQRNRLFAFVKIESAQGCAHRLRDPLRVEGLAVERQGWRDDRQVAQW